MDILNVLASIDRLCVENNVKKGDLYAAVGVSAPAVSQWKRGKTSPKMENLKAMADFFGVTLASIGVDDPIRADGKNPRGEKSQGLSSQDVFNIVKHNESLEKENLAPNEGETQEEFNDKYSRLNGANRSAILAAMDALIASQASDPSAKES